MRNSAMGLVLILTLSGSPQIEGGFRAAASQGAKQADDQKGSKIHLTCNIPWDVPFSMEAKGGAELALDAIDISGVINGKPFKVPPARETDKPLAKFDASHSLGWTEVRSIEGRGSSNGRGEQVRASFGIVESSQKIEDRVRGETFEHSIESRLPGHTLCYSRNAPANGREAFELEDCKQDAADAQFASSSDLRSEPNVCLFGYWAELLPTEPVALDQEWTIADPGFVRDVLVPFGDWYAREAYDHSQEAPAPGHQQLMLQAVPAVGSWSIGEILGGLKTNAVSCKIKEISPDDAESSFVRIGFHLEASGSITVPDAIREATIALMESDSMQDAKYLHNVTVQVEGDGEVRWSIRGCYPLSMQFRGSLSVNEEVQMSGFVEVDKEQGRARHVDGRAESTLGYRGEVWQDVSMNRE